MRPLKVRGAGTPFPEVFPQEARADILSQCECGWLDLGDGSISEVTQDLHLEGSQAYPPLRTGRLHPYAKTTDPPDEEYRERALKRRVALRASGALELLPPD